MASVLFYPRKKTGKTTLLVKIDLGRYKGFVLSTRVSLMKVEKDWCRETKRPKDKRKKAIIDALDTKLNNLLLDTELSLGKSVYELESNDFLEIIYDIHKIPNKMRNYKSIKEDLLSSWIEEFIIRCEKKGYVSKDNIRKEYSEGTIRKYKQLKDTIKLFDKEYGKSYLGLCNNKWIDKFDEFLTEHYAVSTSGRKLKSLKTVLGQAEKSGKKVDPFWRSIKGYTVSTTVIPLSEEEQELIFSSEMPNEEMEIAKDWFTLLLGTGQRFGDINNLSLDNLTEDGFIHLIQKKTGNSVNIPLFDRVERVLRKYKGTPPKFSDKESSQNAKLNLLIKDVCKECGIDELVKNVIHNGKKGDYRKYELMMTKTGRKSMATYLYKNLRWEVQDCMAITGHHSVDSFFHYVGGKNSNIDQINKQRVQELNKKTIEHRTIKLKLEA